MAVPHSAASQVVQLRAKPSRAARGQAMGWSYLIQLARIDHGPVVLAARHLPTQVPPPRLKDRTTCTPKPRATTIAISSSICQTSPLAWSVLFSSSTTCSGPTWALCRFSPLQLGRIPGPICGRLLEHNRALTGARGCRCLSRRHRPLPVRFASMP